MYLLNNVFTNEHGEAITVLQLLTKFKNVLSEIDTYLNEYGNRLNSIEFKNVTQQQEIDILKNQVSSLQTNVSNLQLTVGDYLLRFTDLDIQLSVINGKITNNTNDLSNLNALVSNIQSSITNINNQISTINSQISGIDTRIDIALTSISNLNDIVDNINTTLTSHTTSITTLSNNVNELTSLVNSLQNSLVSINESVTFINNQISAINTSIGNLDGRIDVLENISNTNVDCLKLDTPNLFENSSTPLSPTTVYNLWEYPANVDTDKTLVNIQTSFSTSGDTTEITIHTPNGTSSVLPTSFGSAVNPATLNIDFMYKINNGVMEWFGIYTLTIKGKYPIINYFSSSTNYPNKENKTYPLSNTHLAISFSVATVYLQPHVKITKYKLGG